MEPLRDYARRGGPAYGGAPRSARPPLYVEAKGATGGAPRPSGLFVPRRCPLGHVVRTVISWVAPAFPQGRIRLEAGFTIAGGADPRVSTKFAVEASNGYGGTYQGPLARFVRRGQPSDLHPGHPHVERTPDLLDEVRQRLRDRGHHLNN